MSLFNHGDFPLHSGGRSPFLVDCEHLTDGDLDSLALVVASRFRYRIVCGIPRGGLRFAAALSRWNVPSSDLPRLIVDDVWTTGASMRQERSRIWNETPIGVVIFARGPVEDWVHPLFQTWEVRGRASSEGENK